MKTLQNGLTVFNATPHSITFWKEGWEDVEIVESDVVINAKPVEVADGCLQVAGGKVHLVRTSFVGSEDGKDIIRLAHRHGADLVVGSIIAAQAYPGLVVAMTPAPGYERVEPALKRMNPDKFTVYS